MFLGFDCVLERILDQEAIPFSREYLERSVYEESNDHEGYQESPSLVGFFGQLYQKKNREDDESLKDEEIGRGTLVDQKKIDSKRQEKNGKKRRGLMGRV